MSNPLETSDLSEGQVCQLAIDLEARTVRALAEADKMDREKGLLSVIDQCQDDTGKIPWTMDYWGL